MPRFQPVTSIDVENNESETVWVNMNEVLYLRHHLHRTVGDITELHFASEVVYARETIKELLGR